MNLSPGSAQRFCFWCDKPLDLASSFYSAWHYETGRYIGFCGYEHYSWHSQLAKAERFLQEAGWFGD